jgi:ABC-type branched-subunit amino acid transport system ATPase component/branched-subunit amino acid ABC-type transport system permease component
VGISGLMPLIIVGIAIGSVYGLAGVGLVLTYKTSGIFNFAHGALATIAAYVFYFLWVQNGVPWGIAAAISVLVLGTLVGIGFESFARGLSRTTMLWGIVATVGVLISVEALFLILYGAEDRPFPHFLPQSTFTIFGTGVTYEQLITFLVSLLSTGALYVFFRTARMGKAMRAVVDDPNLLGLSGTSPSRVRRLAWIIGVMFAMASGLLLAPSVSLSSSALTLLVVEAFGAAAIGGFVSLPMTWVGGIVIGVAEAIITKYVSSTSILGGLAASLPFIVLFVVLLVFPRRKLLVVRSVALVRRPPAWQFPGRAQTIIGLVVAAFLVTVPQFAGFRLSSWTTFLAYIILFLSLSLLVRTSGQVSLCQLGFAAIGAVAFSKLSVQAGLPWLVALILAGLVAVPIGALLAIPAIRLSGLYLALATLGFGLLLSEMFYQTNVMFGIVDTGLPMPKPHLSWIHLDTDSGFYYLVLVIAVVVAVVVVALERGRLGRVLRSMSESPTALATSGTSLNVTRVLVFCISAFIAAVAGALIGMVVQQVNGASFDPFLSMTIMALIMLVIGGVPWNAVAAAAGIILVPSYISSGQTSTYLQLLFGVGAVLAALGYQQGLIPQRWRAAIDRWGLKRSRRALTEPAPGPSTPLVGAARPLGLEIADLTVRFGGLVAVDKLSLKAGPQRITGLIGPNGAGKTTVFNACTNLVHADTGRFVLDGKDISRSGSAARARHGLGRTFQQMELCDSFTVAENVALGREAGMAGAGVRSHLVGRPGDHQKVAASVLEAMELCGIGSLSGEQAGSLSTGQRRLVELARCLAGPFGFLLLDEPSSGLDPVETRAFGEILTRVVAERGTGILLVEHDMALVMSICEEIYVMDFGTLIFTGGPEETQASEVVRAAYLGTESVAEGEAMAEGEALDKAPSL